MCDFQRARRAIGRARPRVRVVPDPQAIFCCPTRSREHQRRRRQERRGDGARRGRRGRRGIPRGADDGRGAAGVRRCEQSRDHTGDERDDGVSGGETHGDMRRRCLNSLTCCLRASKHTLGQAESSQVAHREKPNSYR